MDSHPPIIPNAHAIVAANLRAVLLGLRAALGNWGLAGPLGILLFGRVGQALSRIERLMVRFRAGTLRRGTPRVARSEPAVRRKQPELRLPRTYGWLLKAGKHHAGGCSARLRMVLDTPEMAELLAASAQARRILRPLCRALAVDLPWAVDKTPEERGVARRRPRKLRVRPAPFRIPLPRGVLSAARRQGFGKMV